MWGSSSRIRSSFPNVSILIRSCFNLTVVKPNQLYLEPITIPPLNLNPSCFSLKPSIRVLSRSFFSSDAHFKESIQYNASYHDDDDDNDSKEDYDHVEDDMSIIQLNVHDEGVLKDAKTIVDILHEFGGNNMSEMRVKLENCFIKVSPELVGLVLSRVRNDWNVAFTFFLWAGKQPGYAHLVREYNSMVSILGKMRKFDTAWALIDEMRGGKTGPSLISPQTLLIMIRRYCAAHDVGKAIHTFYAYKRFKFEMGIEDFQSLLSALCRYKNVKDAEYLMFCNKDVYPFDIKSFNIILNGWCNVIGSASEGERIWKEMDKRGIGQDVFSYSSLISCYSKASNLYKVLKLFERMKKLQIKPDRKVYNAVIHTLAKGQLVKEAINLMKTMEEKAISPNVVTYNSLIKPLCKDRKIEEAKEVFEEMLRQGLVPTIQTFHAFLRVLRNGEEVFLVLEKMTRMNCDPNMDTYIMLIRKFCRWRDLDNVLKLWREMSEKGVGPDRSSYIVMIHGLFLNGKLDDAYKYYLEMKEKGLIPEPRIEEMIQAWLNGKKMSDQEMRSLEKIQGDSCSTIIPKKTDKKMDFRRKPETRGVIREKGFSFWEE